MNIFRRLFGLGIEAEVNVVETKDKWAITYPEALAQYGSAINVLRGMKADEVEKIPNIKLMMDAILDLYDEIERLKREK
jgi:hypothetical protein